MNLTRFLTSTCFCFIFFEVLLTSCGPPPEWKQKGFKSEIDYLEYQNKYLKEQEKQKWLKSDSKFIGIWSCVKTGVLNTYQRFNIEIMEDGYGKFTETQNSGLYRRDDSFKWKKISDTSIEVFDLYGEFDPYDGTYNFRRFNGIYSIEYNNSKCLKLRADYEFCK